MTIVADTIAGLIACLGVLVAVFGLILIAALGGENQLLYLCIPVLPLIICGSIGLGIFTGNLLEKRWHA